MWPCAGGEQGGNANPQSALSRGLEEEVTLGAGSPLWASVVAFPGHQAEHRCLSLLAPSGKKDYIFIVP